MGLTIETEKKYTDYTGLYSYRSGKESLVLVDNIDWNSEVTQIENIFRQMRQRFLINTGYYLVNIVHEHITENTDSSEGDMNEIVSLFKLVKDYDSFASLLEKHKNQFIRGIEKYIISRQDNINENYIHTLLRKAFQWHKDRSNKKNYLTRDEAIQLAHALKLSYKEADEFLYRCVETDSYFDYKDYNDLIDIFCFHINEYNNISMPSQLKTEYSNRLTSHDNTSEINSAGGFWGFTEETKNQMSHLSDLIYTWQTNGQNPKTAFFDWLDERSPELGTCSKTAQALYRNLAIYAYRKITETDFTQDLIEFCIHLSQDDSAAIKQDLPVGSYKALVRVLIDYFRNYMSSTYDPQKKINSFWRYLSANSDTLKVIYFEENILHILEGHEKVRKADFMFLLFFCCSLDWIDVDGINLNYRIDHFKKCCREFLTRAFLAPFYAPHILEQSMLLAICSGKDVNPLLIYEDFCEINLYRRDRIGTEESKYDQALLLNEKIPWEDYRDTIAKLVDFIKKYGELQGKYEFLEDKGVYYTSKLMGQFHYDKILIIRFQNGSNENFNNLLKEHNYHFSAFLHALWLTLDEILFETESADQQYIIKALTVKDNSRCLELKPSYSEEYRKAIRVKMEKTADEFRNALLFGSYISEREKEIIEDHITHNYQKNGTYYFENGALWFSPHGYAPYTSEFALEDHQCIVRFESNDLAKLLKDWGPERIIDPDNQKTIPIRLQEAYTSRHNDIFKITFAIARHLQIVGDQKSEDDGLSLKSKLYFKASRNNNPYFKIKYSPK